MAQAILGGGPGGAYNTATNGTTGYCFRHAWISQEAAFRPCFAPVLAGAPLVLAGLILLGQAIALLIRWRPRWMTPFVTEYASKNGDHETALTSRWTRSTVALAGLFGASLVLRIALGFIQWPNVAVTFPAATGFVLLAMILLYRPRTVPRAVLSIQLAQATSHTVLLVENFTTYDGVIRVLTTIDLILVLLSVVVMVAMPLREPSMPKEEISKAFSEPSSSLRSPEDDLTLWQYMSASWMTSLIRVGSKRQLQDEDVWQLGYEFQHQRLHQKFRQLKGTVVRRLLQANGIDLVILTALGLLELVTTYATPLLLQRILQAMEDASAPKSAAMTYAVLNLAVRVIASQCALFSLWHGRRCYERSRGEMITMLYEKTLGRKMAFKQQVAENSDKKQNGNATSPKDVDGKRNFVTRIYVRVRSLLDTGKQPTVAKEPASMGKILNLMRNDVYEVAQRFWDFQELITKPLSCVVSITLGVRMLGWSSMIAVVVLVIAQILNLILARIMVLFEKRRRKATDVKLQVITQFVEAIRHLRWYGWQGTWLDQILTARQRELHLKVITSIWRVLIGFVNTLALDLTPPIAFYAYTVISGKPLTVDIAFPAMQIFQMMTQALRDLPNLIIVLINAWVAVGRIEDFMAEPDLQEMSTEALIGDTLAVDHASFSWPGAEIPVLKDVNISFPPGLSVICGEVASGKTALLQALLGEMDMPSGQLIRPREPIGYCAQTPWIQSMSIRENILFSAPYEDARYRDVLDACALTPDLVEFKAGDLSLIGENGIGLSGGQKARVALARAVYSKTRTLLLDDPLSALDQQTAETIVQRCLKGPLLEGRTVVLVTHRTDLVLGIAEQVIQIVGGRSRVLDHDTFADDSLQRTLTTQSEDNPEKRQAAKEKAAAAVPEKFVEDEYRADGGVRLQVYWEYIKAGKLQWWALLIIVLILYRMLAVGEAWILKAWGEAYSEESTPIVSTRSAIISVSGLFEGFPAPDVDVMPWIRAFILLAIAQSLAFVVSQTVMVVIVYVAAKRMFKDIMASVANATFRFYDVTPVGRLMNRMTSDMGVLDGNISMRFQVVAWLALAWISSIIVVASVTPTFLIFSALLTASYVVIFMRFLPTSQSLRRLEMVSLTPLMSNFGALLNGLTTVRAYGAQSRFQDRVVEVVDVFQKMDHFYWSLQAWLTYRFDILSAVSYFLLVALALATNLSPGLTAFVLLAANKFVGATHGLCKQYGQLQMEFVSVERVVELIHLEQEPEGNITPPAWWPSLSGDIVFDNVTIQYAPHLDPALAGISFTVKGGSKTAVLGRTGSGKSTLALAMLATILPTSGRILVDNIDLAEVDKQLLRTRVTFLAQDPVLFPGTMRENLDPIKDHTDEECETVLSRVCKLQNWELDTKIEAGGRNLSQGQRQLVGLARAVLRRSAIIILDEATASIDRETAMQIQQVMHEEMKGSTVITIAHRLEAVRHADYCIVLGKGRILEQGPANEMLESHGDELEEEVEEEN